MILNIFIDTTTIFIIAFIIKHLINLVINLNMVCNNNAVNPPRQILSVKISKIIT